MQQQACRFARRLDRTDPGNLRPCASGRPRSFFRPCTAPVGEEQKGSLLKIFGGQGGGHPARLAGHIGEIVGVESVPIDYSESGTTYSLKIPEIAEMQVDQAEGQGGGPITVAGHPLCIAPGFTATLGKSTKLAYTDHGMSWDVSDKTGIFSPFAYASEQ